MKMKKLIPALCMLLISALLLGTSTYAWFSMNTTVTATGMTITAKSDDTYLLISATATTAAGIQTQNDTDEDVVAAYTPAPELFPSSPALTAAEAGYLTTATGKTVANAAITTAGVQVDNATKAATVTNWFTAKALDPGAATIDTTTARQLTAFTDYVFVQNFYLTVAAGANPAYQLTVTPEITQEGAGTDVDALKFLIVTSDGGYAAISTANNNTPVDIKGSNTALTDTTALTVTLYIYYDGDETEVYTNNIANLTGANIDLTFDVSTSAS
ncbi:MAG: hypothetical protein J5662_08760 [Clostridia bacterium]|nr:hypothetical protein [Clostridia bacterium]